MLTVFFYVSNQADWVPVYDLKAKDAQSPIALLLKANVYQSIGIDWEKVKMSISTGNPFLGNNRPILRPKYVTFAMVAGSMNQRPTSNIAYDLEEDIKNELKDYERAVYDEKTGGLKWNFELGAGSSEVLVFKYTQRAPKGMPLALN